MAGGLRGFLTRYFYFAMAVLLAVIVWYGFSHTIEENLFHGSFPRPRVLYVHAAVFGGWMVLLVVQTGLVALGRKRRWHRWLGWLGAATACAMPVLGTWSALAMTRLRYGYGDIDAVAFLILAFNDMAAFAAVITVAMLLRDRQSEAHKRLVLMASTMICVAALTRFPPWLPAPEHGVWAYYVYADLLVVLGLCRDLAVTGRPHWVYVRVFPMVLVLQALANAVYMARPKAWMDFALQLVR